MFVFYVTELTKVAIVILFCTLSLSLSFTSFHLRQTEETPQKLGHLNGTTPALSKWLTKPALFQTNLTESIIKLDHTPFKPTHNEALYYANQLSKQSM